MNRGLGFGFGFISSANTAVASSASLIPTEIVSATTGNGITDISIDASGATEGYLMILFVTMWATKDVSSYPASWTLQVGGKEGTSSGQSRLIAYTKTAAASETSYTFTVDGNLYGDRFTYSLLEIPATGLEVMQSYYSTGAVLGQLYGFATNSLHLALCGKADSSATEDVIHPTGYTELLDRTGSLHNHAIAYKEISAGGSASSGSDEFTDPDNSNTTGDNNLSTIHLSVAAAGSALSVHPTAGMTLDATYSTIGTSYGTLDNATSASAKVTCNFDKDDTGIIMEHGGTGYGLMLYIYNETLYFQCGEGATAGSDADTGEVSYALTNSTAQDFIIEWSADTSRCALYVNKVYAGRDSFSATYLSGSNNGTIGTGESSVCANRGSYPVSNTFSGTVTSAEIFIGEVTYHV